jgi:hypothetical protein
MSGWTSTGTNELALGDARRPFCRAFRAHLTAVRNTCLGGGYVASCHVISYSTTVSG